MNKDTRNMIIIVIVAGVVIVSIFGGISSASGVSPFQTVVESNSMQHGSESRIGVIDTGDVVILKNKDRVNIQTYVDGYHTGYKTFGMYGDVIIYDRVQAPGSKPLNPIIHRAILWLEYNYDGTWRAPSLEFYPYSTHWDCKVSETPSETVYTSDYMALSGELILKKLGHAGDKEGSVFLSQLLVWPAMQGYITMGDNNHGLDQPNKITGVEGLIPLDRIRSVAWFEVPWVGAIKMELGGQGADLRRYAPNTWGCLIAAILLFTFSLVAVSFLFDLLYYKKVRKELSDEINAPTPIFPVEPKG